MGVDSKNYGMVTGWLPDGRHVVTVDSENWERSERIISVVDLTDDSKKEVVRMSSELSAQTNIHALASPDGKFILFDRRKSATDREWDIYVVPIAGGEARPLIADPSNDWFIAWETIKMWARSLSSPIRIPGRQDLQEFQHPVAG